MKAKNKKLNEIALKQIEGIRTELREINFTLRKGIQKQNPFSLILLGSLLTLFVGIVQPAVTNCMFTPKAYVVVSNVYSSSLNGTAIRVDVQNLGDAPVSSFYMFMTLNHGKGIGGHIQNVSVNTASGSNLTTTDINGVYRNVYGSNLRKNYDNILWIYLDNNTDGRLITFSQISVSNGYWRTNLNNQSQDSSNFNSYCNPS